MRAARTLGAIVVLVVAAGVILWRETSYARRESALSTSGLPRLLLYADLGETDEVGGCGAIIAAVREAAGRGVRTEEVDARNPDDRTSRLHLLVSPTVVLFDEQGHEARRFEGEVATTVAAVRAAVGQLRASNR